MDATRTVLLRRQGLLFVEPDHGDLHAFLDTVEAPLNDLDEAALCPGPDVLAKYNASHR